jgi:hypothetical protein
MRNLAKNKWILFLLGILLLANISLLLGFFVFGDGPGSARERREDVFKTFSTKMHLTGEQEKAFRAMKESHAESMKPLWDSIRKTKESLYSELGNPSQGDSLAELISARLATLNREADLRLFHHFQEVRKQCTPEQQAIFDTLIPHVMSRPRESRR